MANLLKILFICTAMLALGSFVDAQNSNLQLRSTFTFPGQTLANVCGWASPDGHEYALVGASNGLVILDITNPEMPEQIVQIPGPYSFTREIKTYSHYAYATNGNDGIQIVDLSGLPGTNLNYHSYTGNNNIPLILGYSHTLHIDTTKGFLYTYGTDLYGTVVHDLNTDPYNPIYAGVFNTFYGVHDGYVDNDTLYSAHHSPGLLAVVDMSDKSNPVVLGSVQTPGRVTHNTWLLDDHKHVLTTDEVSPSFLTCYDISDPEDIVETDRIPVDNENYPMAHNVQVINDWAVTAWYTAGVVITDCHRPDNLIQTGRYDTWTGVFQSNTSGCWGAYPYFPSGTIIASNRDPGELFILTPTYTRACYLEGTAVNGCDGSPFSKVTVEIEGGGSAAKVVSDNYGQFKTGQAEPGNFMVKFYHDNYQTKIIPVNLIPGEVTNVVVTLEPNPVFDINGVVVDDLGQPVANTPVNLKGWGVQYNVTTDNTGHFEADCVIAGDYEVTAGKWGMIYTELLTINDQTPLNIKLEKKYYDNFNANYNWASTYSAITGAWVKDVPLETTYNGTICNPGDESTNDFGNECYMTGNGGLLGGTDDVDGGGVILTSPPMDLATWADAVLTFDYWFVNTGESASPNDYFEVRASNGNTDTVIFKTNTSTSQWISSPQIHLSEFITLTDNVKISFFTTDDDPSHIVEAAVDVFSVTPVIVGTKDIPKNVSFSISPNPSTSGFAIQYSWEGVAAPQLEIRNALGQTVLTQILSGEKGNGRIGETWPAGIYTAYLSDGKQVGKVVKLVKQ